jgi:tellurite resistance protein TehA-like permease
VDFYHATFLTGQVLVLAGVLLALIGFISVIQRDARSSLRRANSPGPRSDD